jgi:hypothetical protein
MKIRSGFVSNSSSSSFLMIGVSYAGEDQEEILDKYEELDSLCGEDDDGCSVLGFKLMDIDEYSWNSMKFDMDELNQYQKKLKKIFGKDVEVKIFAGTENDNC